MDQMIDVLKQQGLTEKEASCYLAALQINEGSASTIARKAGEKRLTAYNAMQALVQKGFASSYQHNGTTWYKVIDPELLVKKLRSDQEKQLTTLQGLVPQLKELSQHDIFQTSVEYYQGLDGVKTLHERLLESSYLYNLIAAGNDIDPDFLEFTYQNHIPRRIEKGVDVKIMLTPTAYDRYVDYYSSNGIDLNMHKTKKINKASRECEHDLMLFGDHHVAMVNSGKGQLSALVFSHPAFYSLCKNMMNLVRENI